jgi:hypothetical protein
VFHRKQQLCVRERESVELLFSVRGNEGLTLNATRKGGAILVLDSGPTSRATHRQDCLRRDLKSRPGVPEAVERRSEVRGDVSERTRTSKKSSLLGRLVLGELACPSEAPLP